MGQSAHFNNVSGGSSDGGVGSNNIIGGSGNGAAGGINANFNNSYGQNGDSRPPPPPHSSLLHMAGG